MLQRLKMMVGSLIILEINSTACRSREVFSE